MFHGRGVEIGNKLCVLGAQVGHFLGRQAGLLEFRLECFGRAQNLTNDLDDFRIPSEFLGNVAQMQNVLFGRVRLADKRKNSVLRAFRPWACMSCILFKIAVIQNAPCAWVQKSAALLRRIVAGWLSINRLGVVPISGQ